MLLRHVLLLVTFITLVGATFSLPEGLAEPSPLEPTANGGTKRLKPGDVLARRSPSNIQSAPTNSTALTSTPDDTSISGTGDTSDAEESNTEESNTEESNTEESNTEESNTEESNTEESNTDPLTLGSKGDSVRELQAVLKRLGYYYGSVNGVLGKDTQTAVNRFQKEAGLPETQEIDTATLENLRQAERSLVSQKQVLAPTPTFKADSAPSRDPQTATTDEAPDGSILLPLPSSPPQSQGVGEIGWMGWVMGSLAGAAIAGGLVYGLHRSSNRLAREDTDSGLFGINTSKIFEEGLEEEERLEQSSVSEPSASEPSASEPSESEPSESELSGAQPLEAEPDISSQALGNLNGRQGHEGRKRDSDELEEGFGERSPTSAGLAPGSDLPSWLSAQEESGSSKPVPPGSVQTGSVQTGSVQTGSVQSELPHSDGSHQPVKPDSNFSGTPDIEVLALQSAEPDALNETTRIPKLSLVDRLINDLHHADPGKRRGAIWELGQEGDSRAVQPLVDLMLEADSQQRTLILAAIAEISIRTLKPMKRALLTSLQDENADVRKNAIRDTTRIYDSMAQLSQLLSHTVNDPDLEVQETAQWALTQLSRLRPNLGDTTSSECKREED